MPWRRQSFRLLLLFVVGAIVLSIFPAYYLNHIEQRGQSMVPLTKGRVVSVCDHLYQALCERRVSRKKARPPQANDRVGVVHRDNHGEVEALREYEMIVRDHPLWGADEIDSALAERIYTKERRAMLLDAFETALRGVEKWLHDQSSRAINHEEKRLLLARLKKVQFQLPPPASLYFDERELFTKNDVYYERLLNGGLRLRVGGAFVLSVKSWFNMVFTFAHELGHSIDPCELRAQGVVLPTYRQLSTCFQQSGAMHVLPNRNECDDKDQLSETFADWLAVEVTSSLLEEYAPKYSKERLLTAIGNTVKDLCMDEDEDDVDIDNHPTPQARIEKIFAVHPRMERILGCESLFRSQPYCTLEKVH